MIFDREVKQQNCWIRPREAMIVSWCCVDSSFRPFFAITESGAYLYVRTAAFPPAPKRIASQATMKLRHQHELIRDLLPENKKNLPTASSTAARIISHPMFTFRA